jgi:hypothetical protein|tara:strand:+ start:1422 stop:2252 length:831 start_codon:yes stop_codon:yes gene_type:complete
MNKLLKTAMVGVTALGVSTLSIAAEEVSQAPSPISVSGTYEGTITDSGTYTDTLEVVVVGSAPAGAVTIKLDKTGTVGDLYLDTKVLMLDVQLGKVDSVNGIRVGTTVAGVTVSAHQVSGTNQRTTLDAGYTLGPIELSGVDILDSARLMSADVNVAGIDLGGSYQKTTVGANTIGDAGIEVAGFQVEGAYGKINDASVTKTGTSKHALLGVMTTATNGTKVYGGKVSMGDLSAKVVNLNSNNTYTVALARDLMTYSYEKVSGGDSTVSAGVVFKF